MNAYITKIAKFLPNDPVGNDEMEAVLGQVGDKPSKARRIILARNGIKQRYYAMDKNGNFTHTNVEMAANAIRGLCGDGFSIDDIDVLACGTSSPEQLIPSHAVMVHGALTESNDMEVVSFAGTCCAGIDSLKYAAMSVQLDSEVNAVAAASEWS
jgi:3-oxoacyl-[acyl-carrier-protein] synthase-3